MQSYIVIYETNTRAAEFEKYLKNLGTWGRITDNSWLISTNFSATQIRDGLNVIKSTGDRIFVMKSGYVSAWNNTRASNEWIKKHV